MLIAVKIGSVLGRRGIGGGGGVPSVWVSSRSRGVVCDDGWVFLGEAFWIALSFAILGSLASGGVEGGLRFWDDGWEVSIFDDWELDPFSEAC